MHSVVAGPRTGGSRARPFRVTVAGLISGSTGGPTRARPPPAAGLAGRRGPVPDLPADLRRLERRRHRRLPGRAGTPRLPRLARRGRGLVQPLLRLAVRRRRLRRRRLPDGRAALRQQRRPGRASSTRPAPRASGCCSTSSPATPPTSTRGSARGPTTPPTTGSSAARRSARRPASGRRRRAGAAGTTCSTSTRASRRSTSATPGRTSASRGASRSTPTARAPTGRRCATSWRTGSTGGSAVSASTWRRPWSRTTRDLVETGRLWADMRGWIDAAYPDAALLSEWGEPSVAVPAGFHADFFLQFRGQALRSLWHTGIGTHDSNWGEIPGFYFDAEGSGTIAAFLAEWRAATEAIGTGGGHIALPTANHDYARLVTGPRSGRPGAGGVRVPDDLAVAADHLLRRRDRHALHRGPARQGGQHALAAEQPHRFAYADAVGRFAQRRASRPPRRTGSTCRSTPTRPGRRWPPSAPTRVRCCTSYGG